MPDRKKSAVPLATKSAVLEGRCLLSWEEAAAYLGPSVNVRWLKRQVYDTKTLPARRISGKTFIEQAALDAFVDSAPTTSNQTRRVHALADAITPHYRALVLTAYTGLRAGELNGLRWKRLDLLHGTLRVEETLKPVGKKWAEGTPTRWAI